MSQYAVLQLNRFSKWLRAHCEDSMPISLTGTQKNISLSVFIVQARPSFTPAALLVFKSFAAVNWITYFLVPPTERPSCPVPDLRSCHAYFSAFTLHCPFPFFLCTPLYSVWFLFFRPSWTLDQNVKPTWSRLIAIVGYSNGIVAVDVAVPPLPLSSPFKGLH